MAGSEGFCKSIKKYLVHMAIRMNNSPFLGYRLTVDAGSTYIH